MSWSVCCPPLLPPRHLMHRCSRGPENLSWGPGIWNWKGKGDEVSISCVSHGSPHKNTWFYLKNCSEGLSIYMYSVFVMGNFFISILSLSIILFKNNIVCTCSPGDTPQILGWGCATAGTPKAWPCSRPRKALKWYPVLDSKLATLTLFLINFVAYLCWEHQPLCFDKTASASAIVLWQNSVCFRIGPLQNLFILNSLKFDTLFLT